LTTLGCEAYLVSTLVQLEMNENPMLEHEGSIPGHSYRNKDE